MVVRLKPRHPRATCDSYYKYTVIARKNVVLKNVEVCDLIQEAQCSSRMEHTGTFLGFEGGQC